MGSMGDFQQVATQAPRRTTSTRPRLILDVSQTASSPHDQNALAPSCRDTQLIVR